MKRPAFNLRLLLTSSLAFLIIGVVVSESSAQSPFRRRGFPLRPGAGGPVSPALGGPFRPGLAASGGFAFGANPALYGYPWAGNWGYYNPYRYVNGTGWYGGGPGWYGGAGYAYGRWPGYRIGWRRGYRWGNLSAYNRLANYGWLNTPGRYFNQIRRSPSPNFWMDSARDVLPGVHPASLAQYQFMVNKIKKIEKDDAARYDRIVRLQQYHVRTDTDRLRQEREHVNTMIAGAPNSPYSLRKFFVLSMKYNDDQAVYSALNADVGETSGEDFGGGSRGYELVNKMGKIAKLPHSLAEEPKCKQLDKNLREKWAVLSVEITGNGTPATASISSFSKAANEMLAAGRIAQDKNHKHDTARHLAGEYLEALAVLEHRVADASYLARLHELKVEGGMTFQGGTVRDLLKHMLDNNLTVKMGSDAQWKLSALAASLKNNIDKRIATNGQMLEGLKSQHHWSRWSGPWENSFGGNERLNTAANTGGPAPPAPGVGPLAIGSTF